MKSQKLKIFWNSRNSKNFSSRKGSTHVDWVISLGIFLLYIAWFFVFIKPQFEVNESPLQLLDVASDNILDEIIWHVEKRPLFVFSNITESDEAVIVDFPYDMTNFAISDGRTFALDDDKLIFLANLSENNIFWIVNSSRNYSNNFAQEDISSDNTYASVNNFRAGFSSGLLGSVQYLGNDRLVDFEVYANNAKISRTNNSYSGSSLSAGYKVYDESIYHKSYIAADNTVVFSYVDVGQVNYDVSIFAELDDYPNYYANNLNNDVIDYGTDSCDNFESNYIDFHDSSDGLTFAFSKDADMEVCWNSGRLYLNATIDADEDLQYHIRAHNRSYTRTTQYKVPYYDYSWGIKETVEGIDWNEVESLSDLSYAELRSLLGYPIARQLNIYFEGSE